MKLYRVTFTTSLLVESEDPERAIKIAEDNLVDEVRNRSSRLLLEPVHVGSVDGLRREERGSLPWRSHARDLDGEPERTVEEVLEGNQ
jgi:hypothetical protein